MQRPLSQLPFQALVLGACCAASSSFALPEDEYWDGTLGVSSTVPVGIWTLAAGRQGELYAGGFFQSLGPAPTTNIARWSGAHWLPLGSGLGGQDPETVKALVASGNTLYAGGLFNNAGDLPLNNLAKWNGHSWTNLGGGVNGVVSALALGSHGLYVAGRFTSAGGVPALNIARWDGTNWFPLGSGLSKLAHDDFPPYQQFDDGSAATLLASGNDLYVGGAFDTAGGTAATNIARWDGKAWHPLGEGLISSGISSLALFRGNLYVGGSIRFGSHHANIAIWDGTSWSTPGGGVNDGRALHALATDGRDLYAGGTFHEIGGITANHIARWDGHNWHPVGSGIDPLNNAAGVSDLAGTYSELFVAGLFKSAGDKPATNIATWHIPESLKLTISLETATLSWPAPDTNFLLETSTSCTTANWSEIPRSPALINHRWTITTNTTRPNTFFRLRQK